jgi:prepilin-type N-terminal cleavage/methylation domain-containing protein
MSARRHTSQGFTLLEVAISLMILGLAIGGLTVAMSQQMMQKRLSDTRLLLTQVNQALSAFVVANGRLPCPATAASNGLEAVVQPGQCSAPAGYLPAVTLGLPNLDGNGLLNDGWQDGSIRDNTGALSYPHALRYAVATLAGTAVANALTSNALGGNTRANVSTALGTNLGLFVCRSSTGMSGVGNRCVTAANSLAINVVAAAWSQGPTAVDVVGNGVDEQQNASQLTGAAISNALVMRDPSASAAASGRFDDLVVWLPWGSVADKLMMAWQVQ